MIHVAGRSRRSQTVNLDGLWAEEISSYLEVHSTSYLLKVELLSPGTISSMLLVGL